MQGAEVRTPIIPVMGLNPKEKKNSADMPHLLEL
jgi:hypothetical protein